MKDRVYLVLAVVGFIVITLVCVKHQNGQTNYEYDVGGAYTPIQRDDMGSAAELYQQLIGARTLTCPVVEMTRSTNTVSLTNVVGSADHVYGVNYMFVEQSMISDNAVNPTLDDIEGPLNIDSGNWSVRAEKNVMSLFTEDAPIKDVADCYKLIAPFSFLFENINTSCDGTDNQQIVINNTIGNCRITFNNVANWFCAGPYGTTTRVSSASDGVADWGEHYTAHHTVIGNSGNATVKGGYSGYAIGYGDVYTTIKIEKYSKGRWSTISLEEFIKGTL